MIDDIERFFADWENLFVHEEIMRRYETIVVYSPLLSKDELKAEIQKVKTNTTILENKSDNDNSDINNNKNLFITKVNYLEKENKKVNKDIKILDRNNLLKKYKLKKKEDKEIKENFLDFILNENSNYADIDKIIKHYKNIELKKKNEYSNNLLIIKKKKEILNNLNMQINKVLVDNVEITDKELERFSDNEIESKKR